MHTKFKWIIPLLLMLILLGGWRIWSSTDTFASGASIDRWNVGGLTKEEATDLLLQEARPKPIVVRGPQTIRKEISMRPLARKAVNEAWANQQRGFLDRLLGTGSARADLHWDYSGTEALYKKALQWDRNPKDFAVAWKGDRVVVLPGRPGWQSNHKQLRRDIHLVARSGGGTVLISGKKIKPQIATKKDLWKQQPTQILVDQSDFVLSVYRRGQLYKQYPIATGQPGFETPNGQWRVINRAIDPAWMAPEWAGAQAGQLVPGGSPENPLIDRWMGIGDGVGIHGTTDIGSLGSAASHGCIRMDPADVRELYEWVPVGTPVLIRS